MKKGLLCFLLGLVVYALSSVALAAQYDFFGGFVPGGTPTIDGVITPGEWDEAGHIILYKFYGEDAKIDVYLMWDETYLYLGASVEDFELWVDSYIADTPWTSTWNDDAFTWEIDPDYSRDVLIQSTDRLFAINADGSSSRFDKGDGSGGTLGFTPIDSIIKAAKYSGTLNDYTFKTLSTESSKDSGFTFEVAISWRNIYGSESASAPADGTSIGMNFTSIEDDTGGDLDAGYYQEWKRVFDEITGYMGESGIPENWAEFVVSSKKDMTAPSAISDLKVTSTNTYSATISFTATGDNGSSGYAEKYDIRYLTEPITDTNWKTATVYKNNFRPQKAGKTESFKIVGLTAQTTYYIGVKAVDEQNNSSSTASVSTTTKAADSSEDKGYITVDPGGRYFTWENGKPFIPVGDCHEIYYPYFRNLYDGELWNANAGRNWNYYQQEGPEVARTYLKSLSDHGVNTIRIMVESLNTENPVYLFTDLSGGPNNIVFNETTLKFIQTLLDECLKYNISVVIVPFETFNYKTNWSLSPLNKAKGGPLTEPTELFDRANRDYLKAILAKLAETVGNRKNLLAWEIINEFDNDDPSWGWNRAAFDDREETINALTEYLRGLDPNHMIFASSVRWDPKFTTNQKGDSQIIKGADPAMILNNRQFDFNSTHTYYHDIRDPNHNHPDNRATSSYTYQVADLDNTIAPAVHIRQGIQYYHANSLNPKPYFDTEHGPHIYIIRQYDQYFTQAMDYQYFHNMIWSHLASGDVGTGLRWPSVMHEDNTLPEQMRKYQLALKNFISANLNFSGFQPVQIGHDLKIENVSVPVFKTGITDGDQGIIFLINDERKQTNGNISGARLTVPKVVPFGQYTFGFWDSYDETRTTPVSTVSATADVSGSVSVNLPDFSKTQVIKLYRTGTSAPTSGYLVTDDLWIRAAIDIVGLGPTDAVWKEGGRDTTDRGDTVIWGHFYASPDDVDWGSQDNPDLYVKIWFDYGGSLDVNFFHVSVPDIVVYSDYPYNGTHDETGTATMDNRYVRHNYTSEGSKAFVQTEDGNPRSGFNPTANPSGYTTINNVRIGAAINTVELGLIDAKWHLGGTDTTTRGDQVVWGHFYASPNQVGWGSPKNPDIFVKIWFDFGGNVDVNFFHVSVPEIDTYSANPDTGSYNKKGRTTMDNRYYRHAY